MSTGQKTTIKRSAGSSLSQSNRAVSSSGKLVDRWIKGFDVRQANFESRHSRLLDKLGVAKELGSTKK